MLTKVSLIVALLLGGASCAGSYGYSYGPGVAVVDYEGDYPIYYSDNLYWRYDNGSWYRSNNYLYGGWTYAPAPIAVSNYHSAYRYGYPYRGYNYRAYNYPRSYRGHDHYRSSHHRYYPTRGTTHTYPTRGGHYQSGYQGRSGHSHSHRR